MFYSRRLAVLVPVALVAISSLLSPARAPGVPAGTPPEIAAIMRKIQAGGRPSSDDIAKLQAWSRSGINKMNNPATTKLTAAIAHPGENTALLGIPSTNGITLS